MVSRRHLSRRTNRTTELRLDSPGEYKLASSLAPAWWGPHLTMLRPGPCGSGFGASAPQPFSSSILAISPLWARPRQPLSLHDPSRKRDLYCACANVTPLPFSFSRGLSLVFLISPRLLITSTFIVDAKVTSESFSIFAAGIFKHHRPTR